MLCLMSYSGAEAQGVPLDETVAANPEEIELDDIDLDDEEAPGEATAEAAEAAKQDMAEDDSDGLFKSESLHNYGGGAQLAPGPGILTELPESHSSHADSKTQTAPALLAIVSQAPNHPATA